MTLLAPVYWAASRRRFLGAVLGFMVGVVMVMMGSLGVTTALSAVIVHAKREGPSAVATQ